MNYKLTQGATIIRGDDHAFIPVDPANKDYQAYLTWVADGNTPDPADPVEPPPACPQEVSPRQLRLALNSTGLLTAIEKAVTDSTDAVLKIEWDYATVFKRHHPSVLAMAAALNKTPEDMDNLFILAASYE